MRLQVGVERVLIDRRNPLVDLPEFPLPMLFFKRGSELLSEYTNRDIIRYLGTSSSTYPQPHSLNPSLATTSFQTSATAR